MPKKGTGAHGVDIDPRTKDPALAGPATRTQKRHALPDSSGLQISDDVHTALPRGDTVGVDSRIPRDIPDIIEESARGQESSRVRSPKRDRHRGNRSSSGGRKDPSPQELDYQSGIVERNALLADKDLEIARLLHLLDRERNERKRAEDVIEREDTRRESKTNSQPRDTLPVKGKGKVGERWDRPQRSECSRSERAKSADRVLPKHRGDGGERHSKRFDESPDKFYPENEKSLGHSRINDQTRHVRKTGGSLKIHLREGEYARRKRSPSAEASSAYPAVGTKKAKSMGPPEDDLREYLRLKKKFEQEGRDVIKSRLGLSRSSPFPSHIANMEVPKRFHQPNFKEYDGISDPFTHVKDFLHKMTL